MHMSQFENDILSGGEEKSTHPRVYSAKKSTTKSMTSYVTLTNKKKLKEKEQGSLLGPNT